MIKKILDEFDEKFGQKPVYGRVDEKSGVQAVHWTNEDITLSEIKQFLKDKIQEVEESVLKKSRG